MKDADGKDENGRKLDEEANYFAMCLLMPEKFVREEVAKRGGKIDIVGPSDDLESMANLFQVSSAMMMLRLCQLYPSLARAGQCAQRSGE